MKRLTLMFMVEDTARADIALTPERTYYRLATETSIEDGELAATDGFDEVVASIVDAAASRDGESPLPPEVRMQVFVDNRLMPDKPTEQSLRRVAATVSGLTPEFAFIEGFI